MISSQRNDRSTLQMSSSLFTYTSLIIVIYIKVCIHCTFTEVSTLSSIAVLHAVPQVYCPICVDETIDHRNHVIITSTEMRSLFRSGGFSKVVAN